ncbi:hypothetical protein U1763_08965 [Sphingomonas sp. LB2R24]|uniref:hypothetical protein n=1 Tax=Sphingomonas sorbitolis TaxID=3096165 RepID=UPI002FCABACF
MPKTFHSTTELIAAGLTLLACAGCSSEPVASPRSDATLVDVVTIHYAGGQTASFEGVCARAAISRSGSRPADACWR